MLDTLRETAKRALWALDKYYANWNHGEPLTIADEKDIEATIDALRAELNAVPPSDMSDAELNAYRAGWKQALITEREECAKVCDENAKLYGTNGDGWVANQAAQECAADIRNRK